MARSLKKGPFADKSLLNKVDAMKKTCTGIRYRRYGWTQTWRVCSNKNFPWT